MKDELMRKLNDGTLELEDIRELYSYMEREKVLSQYKFPAEPSSDGCYHIWVPDPTKKGGRKQLKSRSLDDLRSKVYAHSKGINGPVRKTFKDVYEISKEEKMRYIKDKEKKISAENTLLVWDSNYNRFFAGTEFESMHIDQISKRDIEDVCFLNLDRYNIKKKAFLNMKSILRISFRLAYEEYWIEDNVFLRVNFKKFEGMIAQSAPVEDRMHTEKELNAILGYIHNHQAAKPSYMPSYALELQIAMGLRRGEIPPLMWSDIKDGYIEISKEQITRRKRKGSAGAAEEFVIVDHTKTHKNRRFPITSTVQNILDRLYVISGDSPYLFPDKTKAGVINNNVVGDFYKRACESLNIQRSKEFIKGPHSFRRNAITKLTNETKGNILMASKLYGNTPEVATANYYTGLDLEDAKNILERVYGNQR